MKLSKVTLYNKMGNKDHTYSNIATIDKPSIYAANWYQVNQNVKLKWVVMIRTTNERIEDYDSIRIEGRNLRILSKTEKSFGTQKLEVGV